MIRTIADLLAAIKAKGEATNKQAIKELGITHPVMIGDMFEGLTTDLLKRALPSDWPELSVSSGLIRDRQGQRSRQIDCMVTIGGGTPIPHTNNHVFDLANVVAVIEVKKTLYSKQLEEACCNLQSVARLEQYSNRPLSLYRTAHIRLFGDQPTLTGQEDLLPEVLSPIRSSLLAEAATPELIVLGYDGFVDEHSLRSKFVEYISKLIQAGDPGRLVPHCLPNLIICKQATLVKLNAMPYGVPVEDGSWLLYGSYPETPILLLLEAIFTRLSHYYDKLDQDFFGEDLVNEAPRLLLSVKWKEGEVGAGWEYKAFQLTAAELKAMKPTEEWRPHVLSKQEFLMFSLLCKYETVPEVDLAEKALVDLEKWVDLRLISRKSGVISLLTDRLQTAIHPKLGYVCGEDGSGQFSRWLIRELDSDAGAANSTKSDTTDV